MVKYQLYRLPTHVHRKYCGIVGPEMQHFTDVLESLSICKARVKLDGSEKPVSLDATRHLPVFWMVRIGKLNSMDDIDGTCERLYV